MFISSSSQASILQKPNHTASGSTLLNLHTDTSALELKPASLDASYQTAAICFLGVGDCGTGNFATGGDDMNVETAKQCTNEGFIKLNCSSVQQAEGICPYNSSYGQRCVCKSNLVSCPAGQVGVGAACGGKYASCQCNPSLSTCASNQVGSGATCGGKYESCTCKSEYQYNSSNCTSPRSVSGSSCGGKYTGCTCPSGVSTGSFGCKEYYPSPCGSICKTAHSDNCHNRTAVSTPYGCMSYFADCSSKCERAYTDNCRNRTAVTCQYGCASNWGDCSTKCQTCKSDNCANRTAVDAPNGCQQYWADCPSKCQTAVSICPGFEQKSSCPNKYYKKDVCPQDSSYIKCTPTCGSRIVDDNPTYAIDEYSSNGITVITKNATYLPSNKTVYSNINFPQYAECAALPKPMITMTANNGYATSISIGRIENIDFTVNFKPWTQPSYCSAASNYRYSSFCEDNCSYNDCYCRNGCMSNSSCRDYNYDCSRYFEEMNNGQYMDLCEIAKNYDSYCTNNSSPSVGVELYPSNNVMTESYTACSNGRRSFYEGTLKNVNITVNGSPQIAAEIGGGAHIDKTIKFEGTNSISGGSKHSLWVRGHNTCSYGIVRGVLQINSGGKLTLNKPACIYNQWNGTLVRNGTISGTVTTNCSTYPLKW